MLLLSTRITEALNKGHKSYYALPILAYSFSIQRQYSTYTKLFCYLPLFLEVDSGTAYPFVISRNSVWKNALNFQNYVYLTSVNPIFDVKPIDAEIYTRKLLFFGRLCRLSSNTLAKKIFLKRLYSFLYDLARTQFGFIPEILQIHHLYGLVNYLQSWPQDGSFPDKPAWKKILWPRYHRNKLQRQGRLTCHSDFNFFSFNLRQYRTIDNLKKCSEIVMKLICLNFSANLPQFPAISTKTKYAYYAKNCLPMYLLMPLVFA